MMEGVASSSKKGDINNSAADLPERTETKAPEVVVDREEKESAETKQWITNETRGLDTEVNDVIGEGNRERKKSAETKKAKMKVKRKQRQSTQGLGVLMKLKHCQRAQKVMLTKYDIGIRKDKHKGNGLMQTSTPCHEMMMMR
ncbi:hypothetical protein F2Q69_00038691 [Brassica cretica]|uniref:Uncharacterized protein n=1 Tax=Brassica cretica TaxID=69181 RepID=A0A8S9SSI5_BRACR|nr:hypothetical protein F2Q69_00038691 [Brassica cretica]